MLGDDLLQMAHIVYLILFSSVTENIEVGQGLACVVWPLHARTQHGGKCCSCCCNVVVCFAVYF